MSEPSKESLERATGLFPWMSRTERRILAAEFDAAVREARLPAIEFLRRLSNATEYKSHPLGYADSLERYWKEEAAELLAELERRP